MPKKLTKSALIARNWAKCSECRVEFAPVDEHNFWADDDSPVCLTCKRKAFQRLARYGSDPSPEMLRIRYDD